MEEEQDIQSDIVKQKQLRDAQENQEFDRDMDAYRRGKDLTDEQRKQVLQDNARKRQLLGSQLLDNIGDKFTEFGSSVMEASQEDPDTWTDDAIRIGLGGVKNVGTVLGAPGIKQGLQLLGAPAYYVGRGLGYGLEKAGVDPRYGHIVGEVGEWFIPGYGMYKAAGKVSKYSKIAGSAALSDAAALMARQNPMIASGAGTLPPGGQLGNLLKRKIKFGLTTPEKYRQKILANQPITAGKQPGDYTVFELDLATRGPGIEGQGMPYDAAMRRRVEKVDYDLITELNLRYGGTPEQAEQFLIYQKFAKKQVDEAVYKLNKKQRKLQIEDLKLHVSKGEIKLSKAELKKAIRKINNTTYYNLGHIRSAKNVWRYEKLFGANRASNMFPEIEPNIEVFNKVTGKRERIVVHGNKSRGARMDIPDEILQMTGTSKTIDEEYLKFIDPSVSEWSYELLPKKLQDELLGSVQEKWKRFRSAGYSDFANYLQEVEGLSWYQFNRLPKNRIKSKNAPITQNDLRTKFNAQTEIIPGSQQLDTWKTFLRKSVDDFVHAQELKKEWSKLKKAGKDEQAADLLLEIGKLIN